MSEVAFYHCTKAPAETVALRLAAKAYESGARLLLVSDAETLASLDRRLWTEDEGSFLPHGLADENAADHPILLTETPEPRNAATLLLLVSHPLPDVRPFSRTLHLFDHGSEAHARARTEWKSLPPEARTYWQQDETGRWVRK
jgi:DNA polymerase-3 subunit chi